ncbi:12258_t:CDS:2 [Entrophospora sp. SA101]|nr:12258_t:CDS:2 [Entrophospora sp. SA101]
MKYATNFCNYFDLGAYYLPVVTSILWLYYDGSPANDNQIENRNIDEAFFAQKAKIISDIELFYLLPNQRRWREWFPDIIYYWAPVEDIQKKIREIDSSDSKFPPFISKELRKMANAHKEDKNKIDLKGIEKNLENKLEQSKADIKEIEKNLENKLNHNNEQMLIQMQTLLNEIKSLKK